MKSVNVAELRNRLSHYLRLVRRGQVLLVKDRDRVVARIEPAGASDAAGGGAALVWAEGAPSGLVMHTPDQRLALAAEREGFRVVPEL